MSAKRRNKSPSPSQRPGQPARRESGVYSLRRLEDGRGWMLVAPREARRRAADLEEVEAMFEAGEWEVAEDELRWLLGDFHDYLEAHVLLGEAALERQDWPLARGHFGYAWELGRAALAAAGVPGPLPHQVPENRPLHNSGKGLAWCLHKLGQHGLALEVLAALRELDPSDPLETGALAREVRRAAETGRGPSLPVIEP